jgi:hypothetical protein
MISADFKCSGHGNAGVLAKPMIEPVGEEVTTNDQRKCRSCTMWKGTKLHREFSTELQKQYYK